jgi:hypothetical protein
MEKEKEVNSSGPKPAHGVSTAAQLAFPAHAHGRTRACKNRAVTASTVGRAVPPVVVERQWNSYED